MLFPTVEFAVFFLLVLAIAWALERWPLPHKLFLLAASYLFYGFWSWRYVPLLILISLFAAIIAQAIQRSEDDIHRKRLLILGVVVCLSVLAYYKYASFVILSAFGIWGLVGRTPVWNLPAPFLPLGISFFVFHAISLMGDIYKRKLREPLHITDALLYVAFFPQLIAGPILRASHFIPQLTRSKKQARHPDQADALTFQECHLDRSDEHFASRSGEIPAFTPTTQAPYQIRVNRAFLLILAGLFKKVILSNTLATRLVEPVFSAPMDFHRADVLLAIYGYAAQIYCDFSGYTDIATGCAMLLGYHFPRNFNAPYTATDPQDFWRRWHISLSSWLRDYLYIPLGGSRGSTARIYANLMITMLLGGLWHGASWTFVAWGGLQGLYLITHRLWSGIESPRIQHLRQQTWWLWVSRLLMFHAVCIGWVFFRSSTFSLAATVFSRLGSRGIITMATWPIVLTLLLGLFGQYIPRIVRRSAEAVMSQLPIGISGAILALGVFVIEVLGPTGVAPFIYFQF